MKLRFGWSLLILIICSSLHVTAQDSLRLSLGSIFEIADSNNRKLKLDAIGVELANSYTRIARNQKLPDLDVSLAAGYLTDVGVIGLGTMESKFYDMPHFSNSFSMQASYVIFNGGRLNSDIDIEQVRTKIATLNLDKDKQEIRLLLTGYYLDLYRSMLQREVYKQNMEQAELVLEKINNRLQAGIILKSDKIRSELLLEDMRLQLIKLNNRIKIINNTLVETLALPANSWLIPDLHFGDTLNQMPSLEAYTEAALHYDPTLKTTALNIAVAQKRQQQVKANYLPDASLYLNNGLARPYVYDIPAKDIYANNLNIGIRVNYGIGKLFKNGARMSAAKQQVAFEKQQAELATENSRKSIYNAFVLLDEAKEQVIIERKKLELASENYRRISNSYEQQLALITDMSDASNQKLAAELQISTAQVTILMRYYELKKLTGQLN